MKYLSFLRRHVVNYLYKTSRLHIWTTAITLWSMCVQVINKYGDLYGAERIAELLGLDKTALDFDPTVETVEKEASLVSW